MFRWFPYNTPFLQVVGRALAPLASPVQNEGINHSGYHVLVAEELLNCPNVIPLFQKTRGKGMPKGVTASAFSESCYLHVGTVIFCQYPKIASTPYIETISGMRVLSKPLMPCHDR